MSGKEEDHIQYFAQVKELRSMNEDETREDVSKITIIKNKLYMQHQ